jgi:serine/threonine-protein kinase
VLLEPGQIFASRYRVLRCIAEGGMGAIFEAEHTATERRVALKLLFPHITGVASARAKFELEARISARVNSPFIVEVLDAGFDESTKSPFLVMELLEGQTLAEHIYEHGPLAPREALRLLQQVAAGLDAAHGYRDPDGTSKPILHRDLKPENLFLARTHKDVISAKILDYGIAKMLGHTTNLSQEVRGTPLFMAFEQLTAGSLSAQTDIWGFGLIAFYMLAGMPYWRSAEREGISVQSLFAEILTLPLELPSVRLREQGNGIELPPAFDAWLLCCINRDPSQRFPTVAAAVEALARVFDVVLEDCLPSSVQLLTSAEKTQNALGAPAVGKTPSAGSVPAMVAPHRHPAPPLGVPPSSPWHWVAAGALGASLLLGGVAWLVADGDAAPSASAASSSADPRASAGSQSASGWPSGSTPPTETAAIPSTGSLEHQSPQAERRPDDAERSPSGAAEEASAAAAVGERRIEARNALTPSPGGPSSPDSRPDSRAEDANESSVAESSGAASRTPSRAGRKPAKPKPNPQRGSSEAYRVR